MNFMGGCFLAVFSSKNSPEILSVISLKFKKQ